MVAGDAGALHSRDDPALQKEEHQGTLPAHRPTARQEKAILAVGRSILVIVWHLLSEDTTRFHDLGPGYYDSRINPERKKRNHIRELEALGYKVTLDPAA